MKNFIFCRCGEKWSKWGLVVLRVVVGVIFAVHGWQKLTETGIANVGGFFGGLGIPAPVFFAYVVTYVELLGGIALILGLFTHWAAKLLTIDMLVALLVVHLPNGFYISKGGYEFVLVLLASTAALLLMGPGPWSLDEKWMRRREGGM